MRDAAGRLRAAQQALEQQMAEQQQMQQMMQQMQGKQNKPNDGEEGAQSAGESTHEVAIPAPEEFRTPEAYRRALLEGMQGDVPDEYEALKKRYYEELVRQ